MSPPRRQRRRAGQVVTRDTIAGCPLCLAATTTLLWEACASVSIEHPGRSARGLLLSYLAGYHSAGHRDDWMV